MTVRRRKLSHSASWKGPRSGLPWLKVRRPGIREAATPMLNFDLRLFLLILSRVSAGGHAVFNPGECLELLPKVDLSSGELTAFSGRHLNKRIEALVEAGLLAPTSNARCCIVPMHVADPQEKERVNCPEHGHQLAWSRALGTPRSRTLGIDPTEPGWVELDSKGHVVPPQAA